MIHQKIESFLQTYILDRTRRPYASTYHNLPKFKQENPEMYQKYCKRAAFTDEELDDLALYLCEQFPLKDSPIACVQRLEDLTDFIIECWGKKM